MCVRVYTTVWIKVALDSFCPAPRTGSGDSHIYTLLRHTVPVRHCPTLHVCCRSAEITGVLDPTGAWDPSTYPSDCDALFSEELFHRPAHPATHTAHARFPSDRYHTSHTGRIREQHPRAARGTRLAVLVSGRGQERDTGCV
jgi:hypothetical protein